MNAAIQNMLTRRSIRKYRPDPVPEQLLEQIAEAGEYAASGMGRQSPVIIAVTDKAVRDELSAINARITGREGDPFYGAPAVLVVLADRSVPTHVYDGSLVMGNLMNAAHALGLGSCWIHRAKETFETEEGKALLKKLGIEGDYEGIGNCIVGYADEQREPKPRKSDYVRGRTRVRPRRPCLCVRAEQLLSFALTLRPHGIHTTVLTGEPATNARRLFAAASARRCLVSRGTHAMCGVIRTCFALNSGQSFFMGSSASTSRHAPAMRPSFSAAARAGSSTIPPRAVFTIIASRFISDRVRALTRPAVSWVSGQ